MGAVEIVEIDAPDMWEATLEMFDDGRGVRV
jgi:hypothetical protein